jgi:UPF0716 family protein affecting phage T7 exclusion
LTAISPDGLRDRRALGRAFVAARMQSLLKALVAVWVFSGAFVLIEPSPYEVMCVDAFGVASALAVVMFVFILGISLLFQRGFRRIEEHLS